MSPTKTEQDLKRAILEDQDRFATAKQADDHETRIRDLEKWQFRMMGVGLCVGFLMTIFVGVSTWTVTTSVENLMNRLPPTGVKR